MSPVQEDFLEKAVRELLAGVVCSAFTPKQPQKSRATFLGCRQHFPRDNSSQLPCYFGSGLQVKQLFIMIEREMLFKTHV